MIKSYLDRWPVGPRISISLFAAGLAIGLLVGRIWARSWLADVLTVLSLFVLAALLAAAVYALLSRSASSSQNEQSTPSGIGESSGPNLSDTTSLAVYPSASRTEPEKALSANPVGPRGIELGTYLRLESNNRAWSLRIQDILGYESLQIKVRTNPGWFNGSGFSVDPTKERHPVLAIFKRPESVGLILFCLSLLIYSFTRLIALEQFPINFFADEANQVLAGLDLAKHGFRDQQGQLFPVYIQLFSFYYPDITVYLHSLTATLFGVSIEVARSTSALLTIPLAAMTALVLKNVFRARYWWAVVLVFAITPIWLLWSRTAFDPTAAASLYGLFVASYLLYRYRSPRWLFVTVLLGAATFYGYPSVQPSVGLLAIFLLISDFGYHLQQRRLWMWALPMAIILAVPFMRFNLTHPTETTNHLHAVNSYLLLDIPIIEKLGRWASLYLQILSPTYWFLPNQADLMRHLLKGYGFLPLAALPLFLIGVGVCLRRFNDAKYRVALLSLMAAPVGAAVADPAIIRELAFIPPATLLSALGLEWLLVRISGLRAVVLTSYALFGILAAVSLLLLQDALANGPAWYSDYTLYGMQWGARQIFQVEIPKLTSDNPDAQIYVSDTWANGTDIFLRFFNVNRAHVQMGNIYGWLQKKLSLPSDSMFVMTSEEYEKARSSPKFKNVRSLDTIKYPDGRNGFYITQFEYADNVDGVFAAEREALHQLVMEPVTVEGRTAQLSHTKLDMGTGQSITDGDIYTLARGVESNPLILDYKFAEPFELQGLTGYFGRANTKVVAQLYKGDSDIPLEFTANFSYQSSSTELNAGPPADLDFGETIKVTRIHLEIGVPDSDDTAHVHVFEIKFR